MLITRQETGWLREWLFLVHAPAEPTDVTFLVTAESAVPEETGQVPAGLPAPVLEAGLGGGGHVVPRLSGFSTAHTSPEQTQSLGALQGGCLHLEGCVSHSGTRLHIVLSAGCLGAKELSTCPQDF